PVRRRDQQHPPLRIRHHHAENPRNGDRRPAAPPRPPGPDQGRLAPPRRGPSRQGGDPAGHLTPPRRENTRPPAWNSGGRQPGENQTAQPDFPMTVDTPLPVLRRDTDRTAAL